MHPFFGGVGNRAAEIGSRMDDQAIGATSQ